MGDILDTKVNESRRTFLKVSAAAGGGLAIGVFLPGAVRLAEAAAHTGKAFSPNAWVRITPNNVVTIVADKSEMGQGVYTSMPMLVAEELDVDWSKIKIEQAVASPVYANPFLGAQATGGSTSVRSSYMRLRQAGATGRAMLVAAAADLWKVDAGSLKTDNGYVIGPNGKKASYGQLASKAATMDAPKDVKLKSPSEFKLLGKPTKRKDTPLKVNGSAKFGLDTKVPRMLVAVVARSAIINGKLESMDEAKAKAVKGVKAVVPVQTPFWQGVAVVATDFWSAKKGRDALNAKWTGNTNLSTAGMQKEMTELADSGKDAKTAKKVGDVGAAQVAKKVEGVYEAPYLAHACMEPMNCTAHVKADGVEIWAATQAPGVNQFVAAQVLGIKPEQVKVNTTFLGGGFGRRFGQDFLIEALQLSKAMNAPVKVVYTREDDTKAYFYRPMAICKITGGLDANGAPVAVNARTVCESLTIGTGAEPALIKDGIDSTSVEGLTEFPYSVPNVNVEWVKYSPGIRTWFWRSVGNSQNYFFAESYVDELAHAAGKDPYEFRRALLDKSPRHKGVLELAAQKAGWGSPLPAGHGRGIAVATSFGSYIAEVAEVSVENGKPRVHRVVVAADVGATVNPDTIAAQMESAVVYGLSAALHGKITVKDGQIEQSNFHDYPVLRMNEMPKIEVYIVNSSEGPGGVGEPGTPPSAPAVANALFAATGKRYRSLPIVI